MFLLHQLGNSIGTISMLRSFNEMYQFFHLDQKEYSQFKPSISPSTLKRSQLYIKKTKHKLQPKLKGHPQVHHPQRHQLIGADVHLKKIPSITLEQS